MLFNSTRQIILMSTRAGLDRRGMRQGRVLGVKPNAGVLSIMSHDLHLRV